MWQASVQPHKYYDVKYSSSPRQALFELKLAEYKVGPFSDLKNLLPKSRVI